MRPPRASWIFSLLALSTLPVRVLCGDVLSTDGFTLCYDDPTIQITQMSVTFDRTTSLVTYDIQGSSSQAQNVTAKVTVTAYGSDLYSKEFNPCDSGNYVEALCPGRFIINYGLNISLTHYTSQGRCLLSPRPRDRAHLVLERDPYNRIHSTRPRRCCYRPTHIKQRQQ